MFKKVLALGISGILAVSLFTACSQDKPDQTTENAHEGHTVSAQWERDGKEHWHPCECGGKADVAAHELNDAAVCLTCGSEVWIFDDDTAYVHDYNDKGDILRDSSYDAEGFKEYDQTFAYEYDDQGNMLLSKQYADGALVEEISYAVNDKGEVLPAKQTGYNLDGTWAVNEYDADGNVVKMLAYDENDAVTYQCDITYAKTGNGDTYEAGKTELFEGGSKFEYVYNEYGETLKWLVYDAEGNLETDHRSEYVYDGSTLVSSKFYVNGVLSAENEFAQDADGFRYTAKETVYNEDGSKTVYEYDADGELLKETACNADGEEPPTEETVEETTEE